MVVETKLAPSRKGLLEYLVLKIVGARSAAQVNGLLGAASLELDGDDMDAIADAIERTGAGSGPLRPPGESGALPAKLFA